MADVGGAAAMTTYATKSHLSSTKVPKSIFIDQLTFIGIMSDAEKGLD